MTPVTLQAWTAGSCSTVTQGGVLVARVVEGEREGEEEARRLQLRRRGGVLVAVRRMRTESQREGDSHCCPWLHLLI